jgi:hypothetical protein
MSLLRAGGGLALDLADPRAGRIVWGETDWLGALSLRLSPGGVVWAPSEAPGLAHFDGEDDLGPHRGVVLDPADSPLAVRASVRACAQAPVLVFRLEAERALEGLATGAFTTPVASWPNVDTAARRTAAAPQGLRTFGYQYAEFCVPVAGDADATGFVMAGHRPAVAMPLLWIAGDGRTLLLAPLDAFHEQIVAVPASPERRADGVRAGWHGDLERVPAGFATEIALFAEASPRAALGAWASLLRRRAGTLRPGRYADPFLANLSYWTDNGAVYYYRTEPGHDYAQTLSRVARELPAAGVPIRAIQIDSWFYPHETLRAVSDEGAPVVPPTGMMRWEPREDLFPDGFRALREPTGPAAGMPLAFHSRHFSKRSPYFDRDGWGAEAWTDAAYAHPRDPRFFALFMAQVAAWGGVTYEQDWLVESFLGVRGLRAEPGRARAWQEGMDRAAGEHGLTLQWCMGTPADWMQTVTLRNVTSVRTSGDYRYLFDNAVNWVWFLHGNALARALGLNPYKDVFVSHGETGVGPGERYAEIEALLAALSAGPVGIGDRLGFSDRDLVLRTCREDGVLVKPDAPIAALDRCFLRNAIFQHEPLLGETCSEHPAGRWVYLASFNASRRKEPLAFRVEFADLGAVRPEGEVVLYDWRRGTFARVAADGGFDATLGWQDWDYRVLCPVLPCEATLFGDVTKYACAGDRRIADVRATDDGLAFELLGAPGTRATIRGWAARRPAAVTLATPRGAAAAADWRWRPSDGAFELTAPIGESARTRVEIAMR